MLPIAQVDDIAASYNCFLYLDEAHATGLYGSQGYGLSTTVDLSPVPHMVMRTFSKAIGGAGAYIACNAIMHRFMLNRTAGFIYSTAPSPMSVAAAAQAWRMVPTLAAQRQQVFALADLLRQLLRDRGITVMGDGTNIVPVCLGDESDTLALKQALQQEGMMVSAIRPPTKSWQSRPRLPSRKAASGPTSATRAARSRGSSIFRGCSSRRPANGTCWR